jgi:hypothetical protein
VGLQPNRWDLHLRVKSRNHDGKELVKADKCDRYCFSPIETLLVTLPRNRHEVPSYTVSSFAEIREVLEKVRRGQAKKLPIIRLSA